MRVFLLALGAMAAASAASGCKDLEPPPPAPFQLYVKVESDPGLAVVGAVVSRNNKTLATTGADGRALLTFAGEEGEGAMANVSVKCPDTFQSPTKPLVLKLTRLADKTKIPEYGVSCPPMLRKVVVAVKAENGPFLPVVYLNRQITKTDASGAAHFALEVAPGAQFNVTLDTSDNSRLKPVSPSKPFTVGQTDDILVFEQKFDVEKPKVFVYRPNIPRALN
jgi:hypothetical protein